MARMFPEDGPVKETTSDAERHVYHLLRENLDDDYRVFHGATWQQRDDAGQVHNGEVDFIVAHPKLGIVLLEVKGGGVEFDGSARQWTTRDRYNHVHTIKDPFNQVSASVFALKKHCLRAPVTNKHGKEYWIGYGVWFPDIAWPRGSVSLPHVHDDLVLDEADRADPEQGLRRLFDHANGRHRGLSEQALAAFEQMLAPSLKIRSTVGVRMQQADRDFDKLTEEQFRRLDMLSRQPRLAVRGAAGTGKTVLALEKARRLAAQGLDVLLLCANPALAQWLQGTMQQEPPEIRAHLQARHIADLCVWASGEAGIPYDSDVTRDQGKLATLLLRSLHTLEERGDPHKLIAFDAVLIDEAQDIERALWTPISRLLRDRRNGLLYAFYDPAQRLSEEEWTPPMVGGKMDLPLTENIRNTKTIFAASQAFYSGWEVPVCRGPAGEPVWCLDPAELAGPGVLAEGRELAAAERVLDLLIDIEGIKPEDILLITCESQARSVLYNRRSIGKHLVQNRPGVRTTGFVTVNSIRQVKGLEQKVVVVAEVGGVEREKATRRDALLYVALSRATHHLVVLGTPEILQPRQPALRPASIAHVAR